MAADKTVVNYVMHNSRPYIFSASIPPSNCATALAALRHLEAHPELVKRLAEISHYVREGMLGRNIKIRMSETPIVPIYTRDTLTTLKIGKALYDEGVYVNPVLPPATAPTECLIRTSYMASHTEAVLDEAMDIIRKVLTRFEL
jgi:7-keto-8-aminopelargonate synthetase-like enzyme